MQKKRFSLSLIVFVLGAWILVSCGAEPERSRKPSADWGRGLQIGTDAVGKVGMVVDDEEDSTLIHAIWPFDAEDGMIGIRYVQVGQAAEIKVDREVIQIEGQVRTPSLFDAQNGFFHLLWAKRINTAAKWQLWYAQIDHEGNLQGTPMLVSKAASGISQYIVAEAPNGELMIAWEDRESGGINLAGISALGEKQVHPVRIVTAGINPDMRIDEQGKVHLVWLDDDNNLFYAGFNSDAALPVFGKKLYHIGLGTGSTLDGPMLGLSDGLVYVFWSTLHRSGLEAGTARTEYLFFPQGAPEKTSAVVEVGLLPLEVQPYTLNAGSYTYTELVPASYVSMTSSFIYAPVAVLHPNEEMVIALATQQQYRLDANVQIAVAVMEDGVYKGYAIATKTQAISSNPVLDADGAGNLHLIWRDGFTKKKVYYTTTDVVTRTELDRPMLRDVTTLILAGGMESLSGILLFPLAFPWLFPGLVLVVIWRLYKNDEDLTNKVSRVILVISILMYQGSKFLIFPTMAEYVPFSAWVDIPAAWQFPLRIGIPLLILGFGIAFSERLRKRSKSLPSTLRYYIVVVLIDMVLTLGIYGVNFMGAY